MSNSAPEVSVRAVRPFLNWFDAPAAQRQKLGGGFVGRWMATQIEQRAFAKVVSNWQKRKGPFQTLGCIKITTRLKDVGI